MSVPKQSHATLKSIAEELGLSVAAVSMAMNDTGTVSDATRAKVKAAAKRLGYRPSPLLAALANRRHRTRSAASRGAIAYIRSAAGENVGPAPDTETVSRVAELGYAFSDWTLDAGQSWVDLGRTLYHRGVLGVLVTPLFGLRTLPDFPWHRFAVVFSGRNFFRVPFPEVSGDPFDPILDVHARVLALGYRRPGYAILRHDEPHPDDAARQAAVGLVLAGLPVRDRIPPFEASIARFWEPLMGWFRAHRPDVVIGFHPGIKLALEAAGVAIPEDCGFVSLHVGHNIVEHANIAGFMDSIPGQQLAALELLDQQIRHHRFGPFEHPQSVRIPRAWIEGGTLPPRGPAKAGARRAQRAV